jgi:tetratricopeptide (TPR) repeat protein
MKALALAVLACGFAFSAAAAAEPSSHRGHGAPKATAAPRIEGLGPLHHPVSTRNLDAQSYFDQGLSLALGFNHDEAYRAFRQAAALDTNLAMAHWGMAYVLGPNINLPIDEERSNRAFRHIREATRRSKGAPENERAYIAAMAKRYAADPKADRGALDMAYKEAMGELVKRYPDDLDAAVLFAEAAMDLRPWAYWSRDGAPAPGTEEIVATLEWVLRRDPNHIGANHLYIHAVEASPRPERALGAARALEGLAPAAGHLVHMPTHIYGRLGQHEVSARLNEKAAGVDRDYIDKHEIDGVYPMMYYNHNLQFSAYSYAQAGNFKDALRMAEQVTARTRAVAKEMPMVEFATPTSTLIRIRFRRWPELLRDPEPGRHMPYAHLMWRVGRGMAHAATGTVAHAEGELKAVRLEAQAAPRDLMLGFSPAPMVMRVAEHMLAAKVAERKGQRGEAIELLRRVVAVEDSLPYDEPPDWYLHARESLGGTYLRGGRHADAERVFREDLAQHPRNGRSLFGLAEALKAQGRTIDSELVRQQFKESWKIADVKLGISDL